LNLLLKSLVNNFINNLKIIFHKLTNKSHFLGIILLINNLKRNIINANL
jgi:hypothetical protein